VSNGVKTQVPINESDIAWASDVEYKFKNVQNLAALPANKTTWESVQWMNVQDEHFIVWMRTAGLPNFRKLWGRIEQDIPAGTYQLNVYNQYDVSSFEGEKSFVISTTNALGGKNYFLAICYLVVGSLCIVFAIIFFIAFLRKKNAKRND